MFQVLSMVLLRRQRRTWAALPVAVMESYFAGVRKITIVGPESTGKTTLCKALAEHYDAPWVEECARGYLENQGGHYEEKDLEVIASLQHDIEIWEEKRAWDRHLE